MKHSKCVIWGTPLGVFDPELGDFDLRILPKQFPLPYIRGPNSKLQYTVYNPRAGGKYIISEEDKLISTEDNYETMKILDPDTKDARKLKVEEKIKLSGYIAQENLKGNIPSDLRLTNSPPIPDQDSRENLLLKGLIKLSPKIGDIVSLQGVDANIKNNPTPFLYALSYCSTTSEEFRELLESLKESKDIVSTGYSGGLYDVKVTKEGRKRIEKANNKTPNINSTQAFIAMWMDPSMDELKDSIKTAVENAGYQPRRIDDIKHDEKIDDRILSEIEKSKFIVCDITASDKEKPRASVFFEAGYAKGKGIPVVWSCDKTMEDMQKNAFDTRQYHFVFWDKNNMSEFEKELQDEIEKHEKIGKGPGSIKGGDE